MEMDFKQITNISTNYHYRYYTNYVTVFKTSLREERQRTKWIKQYCLEVNVFKYLYLSGIVSDKKRVETLSNCFIEFVD